MMGINTANLDPPKAIVVGTDRARLESIFAAITAAGYTVTALTPDDDLAASAVAQAADLAVFEREGGGNTAILTRFRRLSQRPSLAIIEPEGVVLAAGFGSLARGPHDLDALTALLREYLGLETRAVPPEAPLETALPEAPLETAPPEDPLETAPPEDLLETAPPEDPSPPEKPDTPLPDSLNVPSIGTSGGVNTAVFRPIRRMLVEPEKPTPLPPLPFITSSPLPSPRPREDRILVLVAVVAILAVIAVGGFAMIRSLRPVSGTNPSAIAIAVTSIPTSPTVTSAPTSPTVTSAPASPTMTSAPTSPTVTSAPANPTATSVPSSPIPATTIAIPTSALEVQIIVPRTLQAGAVVNVQMRVRNVSGKAIPETFWVDLYVSPIRTPTPLVPWSDIATYGATWQVAGLGPGESRDLYSLDADPTRSNLLSLDTPGTYQFYALADTFNELPMELSSGQARPIYLGGPAEVVVGNASTQP